MGAYVCARFFICFINNCTFLFGRALRQSMRPFVIMIKEFDLILGAFAAVGLGIYLLYALLHPESF
jgi:K+-transporting ATPase KdpF subunit